MPLKYLVPPFNADLEVRSRREYSLIILTLFFRDLISFFRSLIVVRLYAEAPIIQFTDSSFQDCPDTSRSTGGHLTFMQGAVVDAVSTMPGPVSQSTCEAEYCMASLAVMAGVHIKKVFNEMLGYYSDRPLTIPVGTDSQSAMDTATSPKETSRTRHIARRFHYVRHCIENGAAKLFKIQGTNNPANCLTKPLPSQTLQLEANIFQTEVDP